MFGWIEGPRRDRIFAAPQLYEPHGTAAAIRRQSRKRFGMLRSVIEKR